MRVVFILFVFMVLSHGEDVISLKSIQDRIDAAFKAEQDKLDHARLKIAEDVLTQIEKSIVEGEISLCYPQVKPDKFLLNMDKGFCEWWNKNIKWVSCVRTDNSDVCFNFVNH